MSVLNNSLLLGAPAGGGGGGGGYQIERSLRFNSADSAYLTRTPASLGNRKTFTFAAWVKLCNTNSTQNLLNAGDNSTRGRSIFRYNAQKFDFIASAVGGTTAASVTTDAVFRDFAAWYHVVWAIDTTQATGTNRVKFWANGVAQQLTFATTPDLDGVFSINHASAHRIGGAVYTSEQFPDFYLADAYFVDGQALDPTSFGQFDANGTWQPKAYTGSFGTNGFWLKFADHSDTTATTLGKDSSGNGNNWTPNNFSVTADAGNDSLVDIPTSYGTDTGAGGEVRGNYCTISPLDRNRFASTETLSQGNLEIAFGSGDFGSRGTFYVTSGKWYWEATLKTAGAGFISCGIGQQTSQYYTGYSTGSYAYLKTGEKMEGGATNTYGASYAANDIIGIALDLDAGTLTFYKNGASQGQAFSSVSGAFTPSVGCSSSSGTTWALNLGQRSFAYTAPSGYKALCDTNLPAPTVTKPSTVLDTVLYTGTGSTLTPTSTLGFSPDLVWIKSRSAATDHALYDTVRGAQARIEASTSSAEATSDSGLTAFNSAGFTLGTRTQVNNNTDTYGAWCWDAGSSNATNNSGTISSTVRANASAGFSIVTYTGNGTAGATIGHGLGVAPQFIMIKARSAANPWNIYTTVIDGSLDYFAFSTATKLDSAQSIPTSSVFSVSSGGDINGSGTTYVAYCWATVTGLSAFGTYAGNGVADGPFIHTGFRPSFVLIKMTTQIASWRLYDARRPGYNVIGGVLYPDSSTTETTGGEVDFLANGFKFRDWGGGINNSGQTHLYAAFAEFPFQYARAR